MIDISDWSDIEVQLQETKVLLVEIEERFVQVRHDSHKRDELRSQEEEVRSQIQEISSDRLHRQPNFKARRRSKSSKAQPHHQPSPSHPQKEELLKQLQALTEQLEQIEADLESRLLSWSSFREPFWQIVRFGGLGIGIGVILKSCTG